ncbi:MAG: cytochrome c biogenesis protein CcsA [Microscillaceae bacterium]|nr:cytochrome c biogenesis protein CcsA [Microscillaceae bacterium]MDW8460386.1 cytochrome c biogenesis protein [Cytophagales bacterium]
MFFFKLAWWKHLCIVLIFYTIVAGFLGKVPRLPILNESIRNLYFHVPMWFGMIILLTLSVVFAIQYLRSNALKKDFYMVETAHVGILFGIIGLVTGMIWAKYTWGEWWSNDPKQVNAAICLLIYLAFFVLRGSLEDETQRAKISAVYNIFAFATLVPLLFILPRLTDSLHPGSGGNPGFNAYDLDNNMRWVFYPAVVGWALLGWWIVTLRVRVRILQNYWEEKSK